MEWYDQIEPLLLRIEQRRATQLHEKLARLYPDYWVKTTTSTTNKAHENFADSINILRDRHCLRQLETKREPFEAPRPQA